LSVHSFSNLRMNATLSQDGFTPGSRLSLRARLTEYNLPVEKRATVRADVEYPDHTHTVLPFTEILPGVFETSLSANHAGIYRFTVMAEGGTYRGVPFTREQLLTGAVFHEIKQPPRVGDGRDDLCRLLACLLDEKTLSRKFEDRLKELGFSLDGIRHCMEAWCRKTR
jgi:hypothetical protein